MFSIFRKKFNPREIAFALITFYPKWHRGKLRSISHTDKIRGDLALEFIQNATSLGYQVVVVDGQSSKSFRRELKKFEVLKILKRKVNKRSPAKRQAFKAASKLEGVKVIIASEAEKVSLISSVPTLVQPILRNEADIVVPKRIDRLFKESYPDYMYESEVEGNKLYNEQLRLQNFLTTSDEDLDLFFGPRVFSNNPKMVSLFTRKFYFNIADKSLPKEYLDPEEHSNSIYFPIVIALKKKLRVKNIKIPFSYPKLQKENEEKGARELFIEKRRSQKLGILLELMYLLNYLKR